MRAFEQKLKTNIFLVSFIYGLEQYYFESPEIEFAIDLINQLGSDNPDLKGKLRKWLNIKERIVLHYTDIDNNVELSLDQIIVNCNEWANLFKGLSYLFNNYETQMIKRLIKKYKDLGIEETNNVLASLFGKAVFQLHDELIFEEMKKQDKNVEHINKLMVAESRQLRGNEIKGEKQIRETVEKAKTQYIEVKPTLARKAHRETDNVAVVDVAELEAKKVGKMKNEEILQRNFVLHHRTRDVGRKDLQRGENQEKHAGTVRPSSLQAEREQQRVD